MDKKKTIIELRKIAAAKLLDCKKAIIDGQEFDFTDEPVKSNEILVPNNIKISQDTVSLNLHFGENQMLYVLYGERGYGVTYSNNSSFIQCKLVKCNRKELQKGDIAFRCDSEIPNLTNLPSYCIKINDSDYCYINNNDSVILHKMLWKHWYKVVPINN